MKVCLPMVAALGAFAQVVPPHVYSAWKQERVITLAAKAPGAEQCAVLDAATFAQAAPGLRDLRLLQDGREIPYALDESHDEAFDRASSARASGAGELGDRALYETSLIIPAHPLNWAGAAGVTSSTSPDHPPGAFGGKGELPAHVPVERIRLIPAATADERLGLAAWQQTDLKNREELKTLLTRQRPAADFAIGANLQIAAGISMSVNGSMPLVEAFVLEMRRRELCFQPLSSSPPQLLLGNEKARPVHYDYAAHFHPRATPVLATLGPVIPSPMFQVHEPRRFTPPAFKQVMFAVYGCCLACILWIAFITLRRR